MEASFDGIPWWIEWLQLAWMFSVQLTLLFGIWVSVTKSSTGSENGIVPKQHRTADPILILSFTISPICYIVLKSTSLMSNLLVYLFVVVMNLIIVLFLRSYRVVFVTGIEIISSIAIEIKSNLYDPVHAAAAEQRSTSSSILEKLGAILEITESVTNANTFMMMTINRCIDYNKTLYGVKLTPRYETIHLLEAMTFPIN